MYLDHFGLDRPPFRITPDPESFFPGGRRGAILDALVYAVTSGEGMIKVVGEVGSGKTMLCRMLEQRLPASVEIVYLANPSLAPNDILHAIAFELRLPVNATTERLQVMQLLQNYLLERHAANRQVVVFVEEAQGMPLATLEEIRLLSNLETHRHKLLQIVLFGQPELDAHLAEPSIRQLRERITHSFQLSPLATDEVSDYLDFRLHAAGGGNLRIFSSDAVRRIARTACGLIRRVNVLADKALLAAFADGSMSVRTRHVQAAERDSEFGRTQRRARKPLFAGAAAALVVAFALAALWRHDAPSSTPPATVRAAVPSDLLATRLGATQLWLGDAVANHYTIQLLTSVGEPSDVERLLAEAHARGLIEQIFVYRIQNADKVSWGVLYGRYAGATPARLAIEQLPPGWRQHGPFVRGVGAVLKETTGRA
jgi:type II secretory pathway predicted ATPase ExeA